MAGAIGPIDYATGADSPLQAVTQGFQAGAAMQQTQMQQQQQAVQLKMQQQMAQDVSAVSQNPTPQAIAQLSVKYPQMADNFKKSYDMLDSQQQQAKLNQAVPIYAAVNSGNPDVAAKLLNQQADAFDNSGRPQDAQQARVMSQLVQNHPEQAKASMGLMLATAMGPDKFTAAFGTVGDQTRANAKAPADLQKAQAEANTATATANVAPQAADLANKNLASQIKDRNARLGLDQDKLTSETQIKLQELNQKSGLTALPDARKLVNDNVSSAVTSQAAAQKYNDLAGRLDQSNASGGVVGSWIDAIKTTTGNADEIKNLKMEYNRIRNAGVATALPGVTRMTDNDIKLANKGFPEDSARIPQITSFLRGMAKLQTLDAANASMKADWINSVGSLGKSKQDINVQGVTVPQGTSYVDFQKQFLNKQVEKFNQDAANETVKNSKYYQYLQQPNNGAQ